jgi:peptidoglycan/xylan/chitin deacetylase (PgdA/CDA1 family)
VFRATTPFTLFDYFRVPYERRDGEGSVAELSAEQALRWPTAELLRDEGVRPGSYELDSIPLLASVADEAQMHSWFGRGRTLHEIRDRDGRPVSAVWQNDAGDVFLPFDPNESISNYLLERYVSFSRRTAVTRMSGIARRGYYRVRPFLPRAAQLSMRRALTRVQAKTRFPRWPVETALHDLYAFLFRLAGEIAQEPVPYIASWPGDHSWALVLTHDVEAQAGYDLIPRLLEIELANGYRSSWNFVPRKDYDVSEELLQSLREQGFEVGVHGLHHDGRDVESAATVRQRLPAIRAYADRWQALGFRSPATLRSAELMPMLGFDYDSSFPDTAPFEPQAGGCCSWLPYMIEELVELPITLEQDHTVFELLRRQDAQLWLDKARFLRERGGMALLITHPDYVVNPALLSSYRDFLEAFADDGSAWKPLAHEVSAWWRRRAASGLDRVDGAWRVTGPAADEARVDLFTN